jgi:hypothetical protein
MTLSVIYTRAALGVCAPLITVEVHISNGLPGLTMVGLPETTVKEAGIAYVARSSIAATNSPRKRSLSTWHRRIFPKREGDMIYLSQLRFSRLLSNCRLAIFIGLSSSVNWPLQERYAAFPGRYPVPWRQSRLAGPSLSPQRTKPR